MTSKEVEELIELPVISNIPMDQNVLRSLALKIPVVLFSPNSSSSKEFSRLAAHILEEEYEPDDWIYRLMKLFRPKKSK